MALALISAKPASVLSTPDYKRARCHGHKVFDQMALQPQARSLLCLPGSATKPTSPLSPMGIKSLLEDHVYPRVLHVAEALAKLRAAVAELLRRKNATRCGVKVSRRRKKKKNKKNKLFPTFQMHYSWTSSHVLPVPELSGSDGIDPAHLYYDSTWNAVIDAAEGGDYGGETQLSGYLRWLEERPGENSVGEQDEGDEIDRLAERFIARCHEKFRLEKQESYRRYQEMLARSI